MISVFSFPLKQLHSSFYFLKKLLSIWLICVHAYYTNYINLPSCYPFKIKINPLVKLPLNYSSDCASTFYVLLKYSSTKQPKGQKQTPEGVSNVHSSPSPRVVLVLHHLPGWNRCWADLGDTETLPQLSICHLVLGSNRMIPLRKTLTFRIHSLLPYWSFTWNNEFSRNWKEVQTKKNLTKLFLCVCDQQTSVRDTESWRLEDAD